MPRILFYSGWDERRIAIRPTFFMLKDEMKNIWRNKVEFALFCLILLVAAFIRFRDFDIGYLSFHVTRDLYRTQGILAHFNIPFWGSELQYGGRTFGPFVYFLYSIPLAVQTSTAAVAFCAALVNTFAVAAAYIFTRRYFGFVAALFCGDVLCDVSTGDDPDPVLVESDFSAAAQPAVFLGNLPHVDRQKAVGGGAEYDLFFHRLQCSSFGVHGVAGFYRGAFLEEIQV